MKRTLGFTAAIICFGIMSSADDGYYYSDGRQIELSFKPDKIVIAFAGGQFGSFDQSSRSRPPTSLAIPLSVGWS